MTPRRRRRPPEFKSLALPPLSLYSRSPRLFASMAGWSLSTAAPSASVVDILRKLQTVGFCSHLDVPESEAGDGEKLSSLFDHMLSVFLREIYKRAEIRPLPVMLGDGSCVDLFKLYSIVKDMGGFDAVTANRAWASVAEATGLDSGLGSSLKLVFFKYLDALEQWLRIVTEKRVVPERLGYRNSSTLMIKCSSEAVTDQMKDLPCTPPSRLKKDHFMSPFGGSGCRLQLESCRQGEDDNVVIKETSVVNGGYQNHKRKRDDMVAMLNWVRQLAKHPCDPLIAKGLSSDKGKGKAYGMRKLYIQALGAREAMFLKRIRRRSLDVADTQKVQSSLYQNGFGVNSQTSNQRFQSVSKHSILVTCSESLLHPNVDMDAKNLMTAREESNGIKQKLRRSRLNFETIAGWLADHPPVRVPVGSYFQAKVPVWTGQPSVSPNDPDTLKWLGTRTWPAENQENSTIVTYNPTGRGRRDGCHCERPGSINCIRFHIAEKRLQLKREIGPAFYAWGFESMGEEVALAWKEEEERMFKAVVLLNRPSLNKNFWSQLYVCFPSKGRKKLVSYYFNVFLLGRRSYQNRVTPNSIDSDDEETEFGALCSPFGYDAVKIHDTKSFICTHNAQYVDLDE